MSVNLPHLGQREVTQASPGHWLWLSSFGWHDCNAREDEIINRQESKTCSA